MKRPKRPRDFAQLAKLMIDLATGSATEAAPAAETKKVRAGRLGGIRGGKARAASLSPKKRREIAKKAAAARWKRST